MFQRMQLQLRNWVEIGLVVIGLGVFLFFYRAPSPTIQYPNEDKLNSIIDSLNIAIINVEHERDSLQLVIDSSKYKIKVVEHWYEKEFIDITNQSIADDVLFYSNYLSETSK